MKRFLLGTVLLIAAVVAGLLLWLRSGGGTVVQLSEQDMEAARASGAAAQQIVVEATADDEAPLPTLLELKEIASREEMSEIASRIRAERAVAAPEEKALLAVLLSEVERFSGDLGTAYELALEGAEALPENSRARHMLAKAVLGRIIAKSEDGMGALFSVLGDVKTYKAEVGAAVDLDPTNADARVGQILTLLMPRAMGGNKDRAKELIEELGPLDPLRRDFWRAQLIAMDKKRRPEAIVEFGKLVIKYPGDADMLLSLGDLYVREEQWEKAIATFDEVIELDGPRTPFTYRALYEGAKARLRVEGQAAGALGMLEVFAAANPVGEPMPTMDRVKFEMGRALTELERFEEAVATLEEALLLKPGDGRIEKALEEARAGT
ncbi:MAG: tetratricopeptide (TPR) repeat protein [Planctomycetota bacterium]|jgi:tetratricopeptide (TPR) repeat protein